MAKNRELGGNDPEHVAAVYGRGLADALDALAKATAQVAEADYEDDLVPDIVEVMMTDYPERCRGPAGALPEKT